MLAGTVWADFDSVVCLVGSWTFCWRPLGAVLNQIPNFCRALLWDLHWEG